MKQIIDKFKEDLVFNSQNPLFAPLNDAYMGERIDGGFVKKIATNDVIIFLDYTFDNGNGYRYDPNSKMIYERKSPIPKDFFIHKHIEKCLYDIIMNNSDINNPTILCDVNEIEAPANTNPIIMFRAVVDRDNKIVSATNIHVYKRHLGYGKKLLKLIYTACKKLDYRLFLTEMVYSFYMSMVKRGATVIEIEDVVEITDETNLD